MNRISHTSKTFIELGVQDGKECNTLFIKIWWKGLWVDMSTKIDNFEKEFSNHLVKILFLKTYNQRKHYSITGKKKIFGSNVDLLSIDLSVNTFHILKDLNIYKPNIVVTEYNAKPRENVEWICEYDENEFGMDQINLELH